MSLFVDTQSPSPEIVQRGVFYALFEKVNPALEEIQEAWEQSDKDIAELREQTYKPTVLEPVEKKNFYEGFRPPQIDRPISEYPNVSVVVNRSIEAPESVNYDHQSVFSNRVVVEAMVKAKATEGEEVCNRRAQRMRNALITALESDTTIGGTVDGFQPGMTSQLSTLFVRDKNPDGYGTKFYWQAVQIEFVVNKYTARNGGNDSRFRAIGSPEDLGFDQD